MNRRSTSRRQVWRALCSLVSAGVGDRQDIESLLDPPSDLFLRSVVSQGLAPALVQLLASGSRSLPSAVRAAAEEARFVRLSSHRVIARIGELLDPEGIPWAVLKGPILSHRYPDPSLRGFRDLDVLVPGRRLGEVLAVLGGSGFRNVNRNWGNYLRYGVAETPILGPGLAIDLHWHLVGLASRRRSLTIDVAAMLDRRRAVTIEDIPVSTLDAEDFMLHVALHAGLSGATRVVWLRDVRELSLSDPPEWSLFVDRARACGAGPVIGQVLDRAGAVVGARIPGWVPEALTPRALLWGRSWIDRVDSGGGLPDRFLRGFPITVSAGSFTDSVRTAAVELGRRFRSMPDWDAGEPSSPLYWALDSGGPDGLKAYLEYAASNS